MRDLLFQMTKMNRVSAIKRLFSKSNPCTVLWTIISVYINSFNCQVVLVIRSFNPIGKINIIIPFFTNFYTSSTVVFISKIIRILASLAHTLPNFVSSRIRFIVLGKGFSSPTRSAIKALMAFITSTLKNASASITSKFVINPIFIFIHTSIIQRVG